MPTVPQRSRSTLLVIVLLWVAIYATFALVTPALLDDADSVHAEVAREMLLRHDYVTLYANGIRYLEKAPLLYWSMAACMRISQAFGAGSADALAAAARFPIALTVLGLALVVEAFARRAYRSVRAGLYAALILLSSFGIFLFTRITIPDADICLWTTLALAAFWRMEDEPNAPTLGPALLFGASCALNVLSKGLIGLVFPLAIVGLYLFLTRGLRGGLLRTRQLNPLAALLIFLILATPWHVLAGLANPTQGHPAPFRYIGGHWQVPLPTDGNVRGWFWFYFMNEHLLRYLNLRVPRDYDTAPLWLFWGLCLVWLMPWSVYIVPAVGSPLRRWASALAVRLRTPHRVLALYRPDFTGAQFFLMLWAAVPLVFFSFSTRQEYYVLPSLPALILLLAGWLALEERSMTSTSPLATRLHRRNNNATLVLLILVSIFAAASVWFLLHTPAPTPGTDLATLLAQNPGDYALSMGHFLDLNAQALGLFRAPLALAAASLFFGTLAAVLLRRRARVHAADLTLAAGAFGFLIAAHMGLRTFAPVLTSAQLAKTIASQVRPDDLITIHGEYEAGSTLGFYLQRNDVHILEGRSSNLWYGSFFPDAPKIFETPQTIAQKWNGPQRIFLWQSTTDEPRNLPPLPGPVFVLATGGGKEIVSNQPNR